MISTGTSPFSDVPDAVLIYYTVADPVSAASILPAVAVAELLDAVVVLVVELLDTVVVSVVDSLVTDDSLDAAFDSALDVVLDEDDPHPAITTDNANANTTIFFLISNLLLIAS